MSLLQKYSLRIARDNTILGKDLKESLDAELAEEQLRERLLDRTKDRRVSVLPPEALAGSEEVDTL